MVGVGHRGAVWSLGGAYTPPHASSSLLDVLGSKHGGPPLDGATLTVALDVVQAWAVLVTVGFTLVLFLFLAFCVCARKDDGYDEFELDQGITTVKVCHDGGENGLGGFPPRINGSSGLKGSDDGVSEASSRCTLKRELPAIPQSALHDPGSTVGGGCGVERTQSQHSSDLYAAVGDVGDGSNSGSGKVKGGVQVLPSGAIGLDGRAAIIRDPHHPSSTPTSPTDPPPPPRPEGGAGPGGVGQAPVSHPYAKVKKNHPYAHVKLPKKEHPYAKVVRDDSEDPETDTDNYDDPKAITKTKSPGWESEGAYEPAPPVPEKRFDIEEETALGSAPATQDPPSPRPVVAPLEPLPEIQAALAISGRTPANEEMPYMTPPLHHAGIEAGQQQQQQNFSGDSQDSRGYTSISVREPLAALKAQTQTSSTATTQQPSTAPHTMEGEGYYMTVSDDSADEMYACIYEGSGRGGAGSETYAQIEPRTSPPPPPPSMPSPPPPNVPSTPSPLSARSSGGVTGVQQQEPPPPAPPSVDSLKHVVHSRQASSSSAASTVMGSPGAEKRGTRSPLPPLPQGDPNLYTSPTPQPPPPPHSPPRPTPAPERPTQRALEEMYAKVMKKQRGGHSRGDSCGGGGESDAGSTASSSSRRGSVDAARWGAHASPPITPRQSVDLGSMTRSLVETRVIQDIPTAISRAKSYEKGGVWSAVAPPPAPHPNPNYETIPQHYHGSDPGYETVKSGEPAYASVERPDDHYPGYETVKATSDLDSEPGYETLKHRQDEPGYETVTGETDPHPPSEPGYETVPQEEPGYETVTHPRPDPGYEELKFSSHISSQGEAEPGYEVVKQAQTEGAYELVRDYDTQGVPAYHSTQQEATGPVYATVNKPATAIDSTSSQPHSPTYTEAGPVPPPPQEILTRKESDKDLSLPLIKLVDLPEERTSPVSKSPEEDSPVSKKSPKGSPPSKKSPRDSPLTKSPSGSPPIAKSPKASPPAPKSPEVESPPMMKSPSPDMESPPARKSPKASPPATLQSPDKESPPMMKSPSPDMDIPTMRKSPRASPPTIEITGKETPNLMKSPSLDMESPPPAARETPSITKSPSPDIEFLIEQMGVSKEAMAKTVGFDVSAEVSRRSSDSWSTTSASPVPEVARGPLPGVPAEFVPGTTVEGNMSGVRESPELQVLPPPLASQPLTQDLDMEATTTFSEEVGPEGVPVGLNDNLEETSAPTVSEEAETLPVGPVPIEVCGGEREASPLAFSSLGSEDLPPPLIAEDGHSHPQETVNPLFLLDDLNGGDQQVTSSLGGIQQNDSVPVLCGDLPPPPPLDLAHQDTPFTNDLPPPLPESSHMMPRTSTLCEDDAPPPLVPPGEVEGLEDLMGLGAGTGGSSSSGSTAGQPGSLHANSDKDSDSPQDPTGLDGASDDLPPPPPISEPETGKDSDEEKDHSVSSGYERGFTAGGITVTVNPTSEGDGPLDSPGYIVPPPPPLPMDPTEPESPTSDAPQSPLPSSDTPQPPPPPPSDISQSPPPPSDTPQPPPPPPLSDTPQPPPPPLSDTPHPPLPPSDSPQPPPPLPDTSQFPPTSDTPQPPPPPSDTPQPPPPPSDTPQPPPPPSDTPQPPPPPSDTPQPLPPPSDTPQPPPPPPPSDTPQPPPPPSDIPQPPPPLASEPIQPLPPPSPIVAAGSQSSSSGSGSQDTGSGSIESVITVGAGTGTGTGTGTGAGHDRGNSDSSSPSPPETRNLDQHEQITPV